MKMIRKVSSSLPPTFPTPSANTTNDSSSSVLGIHHLHMLICIKYWEHSKKSQVQRSSYVKFIGISFLDMLNIWKYCWRHDELVTAGSAANP